MDSEITLVADPFVVVLAEQNLNWNGLGKMIDWLRQSAPECLPKEQKSASYWDLFPHKEEGLSDNELLVELAGRTCYRSFGLKAGRKMNAAYIANLLGGKGKLPHSSVMYHAKMTFFFANISRRVSHEIIRHYVGADRTEEGNPCLAADTKIYGYRDSDTQTHYWTIQELYQKQFNTSGKKSLSALCLRSVNEDSVLTRGKIKRIIDAGVKPVFEVTTLSGRVIKATACHRFLTPHGWRRLHELHPGDRVMANGLPGWANKEWVEQKYITERMTRAEVAALLQISESALGNALRRLGIKKPLSLRKNRKPGRGRPGMHGVEGRRQISIRMRGEGNHRWKGEAASRKAAGARACRLYPLTECFGCGATENLERHHLDENPWNNASENVYCLCVQCHKAFHFEGSITVFSDEIVSIRACGEVHTYDIEMKHTPHNFVANGLVVHNSQESTRYTHHPGHFVVHPRDVLQGTVDSYYQAMQDAYTHYLSYLEMELSKYANAHDGCEPKGMERKRIYEAAAQRLPGGAATSFVWTTNPIALQKMFTERLDNAADLEIQRFVRRLYQVSTARWPNLFRDSNNVVSLP